MANEWKRGDVVRVRLDPAEGSEQRGERPGLVISSDEINLHSPVILVASLTTRKTERVYPFEVLIEAPEGGLHQTSKVMLIHLRGLDKRRIVGHYGSLSAETMKQVDAAIGIATGLTPLN